MIVEAGSVSVSLQLTGVEKINRQLEEVKAKSDKAFKSLQGDFTRSFNKGRKEQDLINLINNPNSFKGKRVNQPKPPTDAIKKLSGAKAPIDQATQAIGGLSSAVVGATLGIASLAAGFTAAVASIANIGRASFQASFQLKALARAYGEVDKVQKSVQRTSTALQTSITTTTQLYAKLYGSLRGAGAENDQIETLFVGLEKAGRRSGASTAEFAGAALQVKQALTSGSLQGEELRSVMEQLPIIAQELGKELGVPVGSLKKLASEGKISSDALFKVIKKIALAPAPERSPIDELSAAWDELAVSISKAIGPEVTGIIKYLVTELRTAAQVVENLAGDDGPFARLNKQLKDIEDSVPGWVKTLASLNFQNLRKSAIRGLLDWEGAGEQVKEETEKAEKELEATIRATADSFKTGFKYSDREAEKKIKDLQEELSLRSSIATEIDAIAQAESNLAVAQKGRDFGDQTSQAASAVQQALAAQRAEAGGQQRVREAFELLRKIQYFEKNSALNDERSKQAQKAYDIAKLQAKALGLETKAAFIDAGQALKDILDSALDRVKNARRGLQQAQQTQAQEMRDPNGINRFLSPKNAGARMDAGNRLTFRLSDQLRQQVAGVFVKQGRFGAARDILRRPQRETVGQAQSFITAAQNFLQANDGVKDAQKELNQSTRDLTGVQIEVKQATEQLIDPINSLTGEVGKLAQKQWNMNIQVGVDGSSNAIDSVNTAF